MLATYLPRMCHNYNREIIGLWAFLVANNFKISTSFPVVQSSNGFLRDIGSKLKFVSLCPLFIV